MAKIPMYDPQTSEAQSPPIAGITDALNKISGSINMKTSTFTDLQLSEVYIAENDRYRIYQAPLGNKCWIDSPAPVVKKNGVVITPSNDGFDINYIGGSIVFDESSRLTGSDVVTVSATYIVEESDILSDVVPKTRTINGKSLDDDINITAEDVGISSGSVVATLTAAGWTGDGPYTQTVTVSGVTADSDGTCGLADSATTEEAEAARDAMFRKTGQSDNSITITADGDKPTIDIPILVNFTNIETENNS